MPWLDGTNLTAAQRQALRAESLRQYAQTTPRLAAAGVVFGLLVAWLQWPMVSTVDVITWLAVLVVVMLARLLVSLWHRRLGTPVEPALRWLRLYRLSVLGTGVAWGLSAWWLFPEQNPQYQAYLFFVLMAVAIGGSNMLAHDAVAVVLYAVPAFVPVAVRLGLAGGEPAFLWGAAIFLPYQVWTSMRNSAAMRESTLLRLSESERARLASLRLETLLAEVEERLHPSVPVGGGARPSNQDGDALSAAAAAALVEQSHVLFELVRTTREGVWFIDVNGRTTDLNPAMCALLGCARESALGRTIFDFVDDENAAVFRAQLERRRAGDRGSYELALRRPDGTLVHCVNNATPLTDLEGRRVGSVGLWTDISELKRTEARLREYEFAINSMTTAVSLQVRRDGQFRYQMVNDAWCRLSGLTRAQALGLEGRSLPGLVDRDERMRQITVAADERRTITYRGWTEFDGNRVNTETVYHPIVEEGRPVDRVIVVSRDVTEEERASAALNAGLRNLRMALDAIGDGIFASGAAGPDEPVLFHNERMLSLWGMDVPPGEQLTPRMIMRHAAEMFADPQAQARRVDEIIRGNLFGDDRVRLKDGRTLRRRCFPFVDGGHMVRVWTFADITAEEAAVDALRTAEARQRALIEAFPGYISCLDADLRYVFANTRLRQRFGREESEIVGRHLREVARAETLDESVAAARRALAGETVVHERRWPRGGGAEDEVLLITLAPGPGGGEAPVCYAFAIDITAQKRAQGQLLELKEEAERANLAKSEFLSRMSHELRTPMNAIIGFAEVLAADQDPPLAPAHRPLVRDILAGGEHLLELINEVLDLSRVEAGKLEVAAEPVELMPLLAECSGLVAPLVRTHGISWQPGATPPEPVWACADRIRLKQVLLNLLSNAIKYNRRHGQVRIDVCHTDDGWRVEVHDQGEGLSEAQQRRLFVPFERLDAERKGTEGTGIGLALSSRLVDLMRGRIGVRSTPGQGSCFWIWLPGAAPAIAAEAAAARDAVAALRAPDPPPSLAGSLLYVDASAFETALMAAALQDHPDLELRTAEGEDDCVAQAQAHPPSLILLDVDRPELDSARLLRRLREHDQTRPIPVVALSSSATVNAPPPGAQPAFAGHLVKPFDLAVLEATLRRAIGSP
ncbi:PAS domain S-box protein [Rubrivivax albus]|uniref:histidine kinase n=1 Tax=Rubrivivax albus TaxID=2499835 RepID=A0A437JZ71_9BURK|nr:PAS domain S-box protein [Rubrivivax albus]RVT53341.1 PAS domain S-box protein [Rubrivivax albus]